MRKKEKVNKSEKSKQDKSILLLEYNKLFGNIKITIFQGTIIYIITFLFLNYIINFFSNLFTGNFNVENI